MLPSGGIEVLVFSVYKYSSSIQHFVDIAQLLN